MLDLLLPRTDAGVLVQALVAAIVLVVANVAVRDRAREARIFVVGFTVLVVAGFGLRALH